MQAKLQAAPRLRAVLMWRNLQSSYLTLSLRGFSQGYNMPSWIYLLLCSGGSFFQPPYCFHSSFLLHHALKTRAQTDSMLEILHFCDQMGQIYFIQKDTAAELILVNRCPFQQAGSKTTVMWVVATCRSMLREDICHYLYPTQVYINYIFAGRQPTVKLSEKQLYNGLTKRLKKKNTQ